MAHGKRFDVVCVGIIVNDILARGVRKEMLDRDDATVESIHMCAGGDALNQAVICAKLGLRSALAGKVGDDAFGKSVLRDVTEQGVHTEGICIGQNCRTAVSIVLIQEKGSRAILSTTGTNIDTLSLDDLDFSYFRSADIVSIGSLFAIPGLNAAAVQKIYQAAKESGAISVADACLPNTEGISLERVAPYINGLDYFVPSYSEAKVMTGESDPEKTARLLLHYVNQAVIVKLGAEGCLVCTHEETFRVPAFPAEVVDTTGAGDNFVAGFIWGLSQKLPLKECCRLASAVGSLSTTKVGANIAIESADQVWNYLKKIEEGGV